MRLMTWCVILCLTLSLTSGILGCKTTKTTAPDGTVVSVTEIDSQTIAALAPLAVELGKEIADIASQIKNENDSAKVAQLTAKQEAAAARLANINALIDKFVVKKLGKK